jgi:hypothetical protein
MKYEKEWQSQIILNCLQTRFLVLQDKLSLDFLPPSLPTDKRRPNWHFVLVPGSSVPLLISLLIATPLHTPQLCLVFKVAWADPGDLWLVNPLVNPLWLPPPISKIDTDRWYTIVRNKAKGLLYSSSQGRPKQTRWTRGEVMVLCFWLPPKLAFFYVDSIYASRWSQWMVATKPIWYHVHCETNTGGWYEGVTMGFQLTDSKYQRAASKRMPAS